MDVSPRKQPEIWFILCAYSASLFCITNLALLNHRHQLGQGSMTEPIVWHACQALADKFQREHDCPLVISKDISDTGQT